MVVKQDVQEALEPARRLRERSLIALVVLSCAGFIAALFLARSIVQPITRLTEATERIADGKLGERAPIAGSAEFRVLGERFNQMADRLAEEQALLEQRVAERTEALASSRNRFDDMVRRIPVGVYVFRFRADGGIAFDYVSPRFCELIGVPEATLMRDASQAFAAIHPDDLPEVARLNDIAARTMAPFRVECRFKVGGDNRWFRLASDGIELPEGGSLWNGVLTDITESKLAEAAIQESQQRLALATRAAGIGIWDWDLRNDALLWDDAMFRLYHARPEDFSGALDAWTSRVLPEDLARLRGELDAAIAGESAFDTEFRVRGPDGELHYLRALAMVVRGEDNTAVRMVGTNWDITGRKRDELALKQAADEQSTIFETATLGICLLRNRVVIKCNRRLEEMLGAAPGELIGHSTRSWYLDETAYIAGGEIYGELAAGGIHRRDQVLQRRDGSRFVSRLSGRAIDPDDLSRGAVWTFDDVTQERQTVADLEAARRAADAASQAKSEFLANMSHEIRTPMNAVLGLTQLVLDGELAREQREYLETVLTSGRALLGVLNDVLDYSKVEAGRIEIEQVPMSIEALLRGVADLFAARAEEKRLELFLDVAPGVPTEVEGDPLRLTQVLNNLVGNAIKFTDRGEVAVRVEVAGREGDTVRLRFAVRDTGVGLSGEQAGRLFQAFTQADGSVTRRHGGTGLGLAISRKLVGLMGGEIAVSSALGAGATFSFTVAVRTLGEAVPLPAPLAGSRALIVSAHDTARETVGRWFADAGATVAVAPDAANALRQIESARDNQQPFDLALLDWSLPDPGAAVVAQALRAVESGGAQAPCVLLALVGARERAELSSRAPTLGVSAIAAKPVTASQLFDLIAQARAGAHPKASERLGAKLPHYGATRVLLAEDNLQNQQVAAGLLARRGITVTLAGNGEEALAHARASRFDLILMDLHMPVMDGLQATHAIRQLPGCEQVPVVAMTAAVLPEDRARCVAVGMVDFIPKPVEPAVLDAVLARWLTAEVGEVQNLAPPRTPAAVLPALPGFDLAGAMRRMEGDTALLWRLLQGFADAHAQVVDEIAAVRGAGRREEAIARLHALKGAAANLGAEVLAHAAATYEQALRDGGAIEASAQAFGDALVASLERIRSLSAPAPAAAAPAANALGPLLAALTPYLEGHELVPDALLETLRQRAEYDPARGLLTRLLRQIEHFDADGALATLAQLAATHDLERSA
nr:response regulator [Niveibacterium umoris]